MTRAQTVLKVALKKIHPDAKVPRYQTVGAAGFDIHARLDEPVTIIPGETKLISTGIAVSVGDPGFALYLMSRSGLASKGISLGNGIGLIDSDYQGELMVLLRNGGMTPFLVANEDRIAQGVFGPVLQAEFVVVSEFAEKTERGEAGFGSTGVRSAKEVMLEAAGGPPDVSELMDDEEGLIVEEPSTLEGSAA